MKMTNMYISYLLVQNCILQKNEMGTCQLWDPERFQVFGVSLYYINEKNMLLTR